jgi:hypothetical protein
MFIDIEIFNDTLTILGDANDFLLIFGDYMEHAKILYTITRKGNLRFFGTQRKKFLNIVEDFMDEDFTVFCVFHDPQDHVTCIIRKDEDFFELEFGDEKHFYEILPKFAPKSLIENNLLLIFQDLNQILSIIGDHFTC